MLPLHVCFMEWSTCLIHFVLEFCLFSVSDDRRPFPIPFGACDHSPVCNHPVFMRVVPSEAFALPYCQPGQGKQIHRIQDICPAIVVLFFFMRVIERCVCLGHSNFNLYKKKYGPARRACSVAFHQLIIYTFTSYGKLK